MAYLSGLTGIDTLSKGAVVRLLDTAEALRSRVRDEGTLDLLPGRSVALLFLEPSTRTRCSFEMAAVRLGMHPLLLAAEGSSAAKGESLQDTARLLEAIGCDVLVVRHAQERTPERLAALLSIPVINAGDGTREHPTQALLDALTLRDHLRSLAGRTVAIVGDVKHSRVARSNCLLLGKLGARVVLAGPPAMCPQSLAELGARVTHDFDDALSSADAVMMLRIQKERMEPGALPDDQAFARDWRLDSDRLEAHSNLSLVMHPAPMNRGVEITDAVADGPRSVVFEQMANGVYARMAAILLVLTD